VDAKDVSRQEPAGLAETCVTVDPRKRGRTRHVDRALAEATTVTRFPARTPEVPDVAIGEDFAGEALAPFERDASCSPVYCPLRRARSRSAIASCRSFALELPSSVRSCIARSRDRCGDRSEPVDRRGEYRKICSRVGWRSTSNATEVGEPVWSRVFWSRTSGYATAQTPPRRSPRSNDDDVVTDARKTRAAAMPRCRTDDSQSACHEMLTRSSARLPADAFVALVCPLQPDPVRMRSIRF